MPRSYATSFPRTAEARTPARSTSMRPRRSAERSSGSPTRRSRFAIPSRGWWTSPGSARAKASRSSVAEAIDVAYGVTSEELREVLPGSDVLFAWRPRRGPLEEAWDRAGDLRWIQSASAGVDGLMFPGLVEGDVVLTNARGVFDEAIAEFVVGVLALFAKDLIGILDRQRRGEWLHEETERLASKRVLIVGVGPVGRAMARSCGALGMRVRGVGRTARTGDEAFGTIHGST